MSESPHVIDYARPLHRAWSPEESRRARRLLLLLGMQAALILVYSWGGAALAKRATGSSGLDSRFTGTNDYIYWLIDVPMVVAFIVPIGVAVVAWVMVSLNRWRARFLYVFFACVAAWFVTMCGLVFLSMDIDP